MARPSQPNIVVIRSDDIGIREPSCYSQGTVGDRTSNVDRTLDRGGY
jgi:arylsulfatase